MAPDRSSSVFAKPRSNLAVGFQVCESRPRSITSRRCSTAPAWSAPSYEVDGLFTVLTGAIGLSVLWPRVTVEPTSAAEASNRVSSIFKVTNTTFYTLEDVRIEATLWCAKIGLGSDTITDTQATRLNPQQHVKAVELLLACSSTTPPWRISRDPRTRGCVTSILQRGVISILRLQRMSAQDRNVTRRAK